jgi:neutral trehalase
MKKAYDNLDPKLRAVILELQEKRETLDKASIDLQRACQQLKDMARQTKDDGAAKYLMVANAHHRYAGAVQQGLKRASSIDRLLDGIQLQPEEKQQPKKGKLPEKQKPYTLPGGDGSFYELYGDLLDE